MEQGIGFEGFSVEASNWLAGLEANNTREFFDANRAVYEREVLDVSKQYVVAMGEALGERLSDRIVAEPRVNGSITPINRDIRFSPDKTPYKSHLRYVFWAGGGKKALRPALQMRMDSAVAGFMGGMHGFADKSHLTAYQRAVDDEQRGESLVGILDAASDAGFAPGGEGYKRVPKPYSADHRRADLLRHKGLYVARELPLTEAVHTAEFVDWCVDVFEPMMPVFDWLVEVVDTA